MTSDVPYPPAEQPADGDRTGQVPPPGSGGPVRYSASASVPVPPPSSQQGQPNQGQQPQGNPIYPPGAYGQPVSPPGQQYAPSGGGQGPGRPPQYSPQAGQGQQSPWTSPPNNPANSGGYGPPSGPQGGHPQGGGQGGQHGGGQGPHSGGQGGPPPGTYGQPTQTFSPQPGYGPPQGGPSQGVPPGGGYPGGGYQGQPPMGQSPMGQGGFPPPGGYPSSGGEQGRPPEHGRGGVPTGGWPYVDQPPEPAKPRRRWLLITVFAVIGLLLVAGAAGIGYAVTHRGDAYKVGACVQQDGGGAKVVDCATPGAYEIVSLVESAEQCPDPKEPSVLLSGGGKANQVACLKKKA
jgi:hypothetical protein